MVRQPLKSHVHSHKQHGKRSQHDHAVDAVARRGAAHAKRLWSRQLLTTARDQGCQRDRGVGTAKSGTIGTHSSLHGEGIVRHLESGQAACAIDGYDGVACGASGATTEGSLGGGERTVTARPGHREDRHRGGRRVDGAAIAAAAAAA